ncbi:traf2 and NCK-interacting protein kinase-like [Xenopus laevis]|uniref:Traf2 and NCK-interacting protein kinase-like n=1 Tax=Xenopus laevis TaxID=8355 RepID=A0A8J1L615_XENLA|nr:traf2 and NCK-interacting protein kinase-like [Xenopus laevis]
MCGSNLLSSLNHVQPVGNATCQELKPEEELEPATTICQVAPETPDIDICQETTQKSGNDTCQPELENQQESAEINQENQQERTEVNKENQQENAETNEEVINEEIAEESGTNTCQPEISKISEEQVGDNNNQAYQHLLATKYPKPRSYVQVLEPIGEDSYGVIYNGWHRKEQKEVAVTIMKDEEKQKEVLNELQVLETISGHGNIIGYYGAYFQPASVKMPEYEGLWISMERYSGTSIKQLFNSNISHSLKEGWIAYTCKEVLKGLCHLDKHKVIHHDLRPNNIMITSDAEVKISDVSYATIGENSHSTAGALPYMAPEVLVNTNYKVIEYTSKADVWSLGISALEMAEGYYPFSRFPSHARIKRIMHGPAPVLLWDSWSDNFHDFIKKCLQKNPDWRPSAEQLLSHPFVRNIWNERGVKSNIKWHLQREMKH